MRSIKNKNLSLFQITAIILTAILLLMSIVLVGIIIHRKNQIEELKDKNDKIANSSITYFID